MEKVIYNFYIESNIQENHWWFKARNNIIFTVLSNFLNVKEKNDYEILDIGCGLGQIFPILEKFGHVEGVEKNPSFVKVLKNKYPNIKIYNTEFPSPNLDNKKFDLISMFDFLEHTEKPENILRSATNILKDEGLLLITVPAYSWMWSKIDELGHHYRRYDKDAIKREIEGEGFENLYLSYFITLLFPLAFIHRKIISFFFPKKRMRSDFDIKKPINILNKILYYIMNIETYFIRRKISFIYGLSIIGVFKKKN